MLSKNFKDWIADLGIEGKDIIKNLEKDIKTPFLKERKRIFLPHVARDIMLKLSAVISTSRAYFLSLVLPEDMGLVDPRFFPMPALSRLVTEI